MTSAQRIQKTLWRLLYPIFPYVQRPFLIFHEKGRQRYHLGWLAPGKTLTDVTNHLTTQGFGNHFVAWHDEGQILSWRKLDGFEWQYHLRIFEDGELRGHFERTPEAAPIKHFAEVGEVDKHEDFLKFLGEFVVQDKHDMHLAYNAQIQNSPPQITYSGD